MFEVRAPTRGICRLLRTTPLRSWWWQWSFWLSQRVFNGMRRHRIKVTHSWFKACMHFPYLPMWHAQIYDAAEIFAGKGVLSRCLLAGGYATASLDILHFTPWLAERTRMGRRKLCKGNALDLTSPAGFGFLSFISWTWLPFCAVVSVKQRMNWNVFPWWVQPKTYTWKHHPCVVPPRLLLSTILRSKPSAVFTFGLVCSSFVAVSRGTTHRSFFLPLGDPTSKSVQLGNILCSRSAWFQDTRHYSIYV